VVGDKLQKSDIFGEKSQESDIFGEKLQESDIFGEKLEESDIFGEKLQESDIFGEKLQESDIFGEKLQESDIFGEKLQGLPTHQVFNVLTSYQQIPWSSVVIMVGTTPMSFSCFESYSFLEAFPCTKTFYLDIIQRSRLWILEV